MPFLVTGGRFGSSPSHLARQACSRSSGRTLTIMLSLIRSVFVILEQERAWQKLHTAKNVCAKLPASLCCFDVLWG